MDSELYFEEVIGGSQGHGLKEPMLQARCTERSDQWRLHGILALLGLCAVLVIVLSTWRYGASNGQDTVMYVSAARSLLAGKGYQYYFGEPYTQWPPLYPLLLAAPGLTGIDPLSAAGLVNGVAFGLIVFLSGQLFLRCTGSAVLAVAGALSVLASRTLIELSVAGNSEPVFAALAILFAIGIARFLRRGSPSSLLWISVVAALACLQRYAGVSLILAGVLLIALNASGASLLRRLKYITIFGVVSLTPVAMWCVRNHRIASRPVGGHQFRSTSVGGVVDSLHSAAETMAAWLVPWKSADTASAGRLGLAVVLIGVLIVWSRLTRQEQTRSGNDRAEEETRQLRIWTIAVIGTVYFAFVTVCGAVLGWLPEQRHMMPVYAFFMALIVTAIDGAGRLLPVEVTRSKWAAVAVMVLCVLWNWHPLLGLYEDTTGRMADGAGGFATSKWHHSPTVKWLQDHPLNGRICSNASEGIYLLTGIVTLLTPQTKFESSVAEFARRTASGENYMVWFNWRRAALVDLPEIVSQCRLEEIARLDDGAVYRCLGPGGSGASAVYRLYSPKTRAHFYTVHKKEKDALCKGRSSKWTCEATSFLAFMEGRPGTCPVYRFRSKLDDGYFYTINEPEKDRLVRQESDAWTYDSIAFYAFPEQSREDLVPVYRLRNRQSGHCFYTADERERGRLLTASAGGWTDEGVAWYAYGDRVPATRGGGSPGGA
jgi:hypothetical protein